MNYYAMPPRSRFTILLLTVVLVVACLCDGTHGLALGKQKMSKAATTIITDQAVAIFARQYPFGRDPIPPNPWLRVGMPDRDLDGTLIISKSNSSNANSPRRRLTDITETQARAAFTELSNVYGAEEALEMVKIFPLALALDYKVFDESFREFAKLFGPDEARGMVRRNPGLLAVGPAEAASSDKQQTMVVSYVLAATRPFGSLLLAGIVLLLLTPLLELVTGIPIRTAFLSTLTGADPADVAATYQQVGSFGLF